MFDLIKKINPTYVFLIGLSLYWSWKRYKSGVRSPLCTDDGIYQFNGYDSAYWHVGRPNKKGSYSSLTGKRVRILSTVKKMNDLRTVDVTIPNKMEDIHATIELKDINGDYKSIFAYDKVAVEGVVRFDTEGNMMFDELTLVPVFALE